MIACRPSLIRRTALLLLVLAASACGFHPRGAAPLPPVMERTYVDFEQPYGELSRALRAELSAGGARIVDSKEDATAILWLGGYRSDRRILSVSRSAKATEYELFEEIKFSLQDAKGAMLLKRQALRTTRDYVFDEARLLGKEEEAEDLRHDMRQHLARQVLDRIRAGVHSSDDGQ